MLSCSITASALRQGGQRGVRASALSSRLIWAGARLMLKLDKIDVMDGRRQALFGLSLEVARGEFVALLGANGAGKTTTLRTISGLIRPTRGQIEFDGNDLCRMPPPAIVRLGIS